MKKPLTDQLGEVRRDITAEEFAEFRPLQEVDKSLHQALTNNTLLSRPVGRPKVEVTKQAVSIRLDAEVVNYFRTSGKGWQTRINDILLQHIESIGRPSKV